MDIVPSRKADTRHLNSFDPKKLFIQVGEELGMMVDNTKDSAKSLLPQEEEEEEEDESIDFDSIADQLSAAPAVSGVSNFGVPGMF